MKSSVGSTDTTLIGCVQRNDPGAWDVFVDLYGPWIFGWARRLGLGADEAADATQETFISVVSSLERFRRSKPGDSLRAWLWTILSNKVRDQHRRRGGKLPLASDLAAGADLAALIPAELPDESSDAGAKSEREALIGRALAQVQSEFTERSWQAFWLVVVDGRSTADAAAELNMKPDAVRKAKSRVLFRLRQQLDEFTPPRD